jgi:hypothetical protein
VQQPAAAQIDNSNAIVFELRDEHVFARRIEREMIDAAVNCPKWDLVLEFEKLAVLLRNARARSYYTRQNSHQQSKGDEAPDISSATLH